MATSCLSSRNFQIQKYRIWHQKHIFAQALASSHKHQHFCIIVRMSKWITTVGGNASRPFRNFMLNFVCLCKINLPMLRSLQCLKCSLHQVARLCEIFHDMWNHSLAYCIFFSSGLICIIMQNFTWTWEIIISSFIY